MHISAHICLCKSFVHRFVEYNASMLTLVPTNMTLHPTSNPTLVPTTAPTFHPTVKANALRSYLLLPQNKLTLRRLLKNHILPEEYLRAELTAGAMQSLDGSDLVLHIDGAHATIGSGGTHTAQVTCSDMLAKNGVVHTVDAILVPPGLVALVDGISSGRITTCAMKVH